MNKLGEIMIAGVVEGVAIAQQNASEWTDLANQANDYGRYDRRPIANAMGRPKAKESKLPEQPKWK